MKALGIKDNFRIEVTPRNMGDFGSISMSEGLLYGYGADAQKRRERDIQERCEEIAQSIKRHADNVGSVEVAFDQEQICSHCGARWTENSNTYNGGCCDADQDAEDARLAQGSLEVK